MKDRTIKETDIQHFSDYRYLWGGFSDCKLINLKNYVYNNNYSNDYILY